MLSLEYRILVLALLSQQKSQEVQCSLKQGNEPLPHLKSCAISWQVDHGMHFAWDLLKSWKADQRESYVNEGNVSEYYNYKLETIRKFQLKTIENSFTNLHLIIFYKPIFKQNFKKGLSLDV